MLEQQQCIQQTPSSDICFQIRMRNSQIFRLSGDEDKFLQKLDELNKRGCLGVGAQSYQQAKACFDEAERILEYAAQCGKTIQRNLITTILNNQAAIYQEVWELQRASSYVEAIIYNVTDFLNVFPAFEYTPSILDVQSGAHADLAIFLDKKLALAKYQIQYCAIVSQFKNNQVAFKSASTAFRLLSQVAFEYYQYSSYQQDHSSNQLYILKQIASAKEFQLDQNLPLQKYQCIARRYIQEYQTRQIKCTTQIQNQFKFFIVGQFMKIPLLDLNDKINVETSISNALSQKEKIYLALYLSLAYFTMATEMRHISALRYPLNDQSRKNSKEFILSQLYHLISLSVSAKFLPCRSAYFDHIFNNFKNNYEVNFQSLPNAAFDTKFIFIDDMFLQTKQEQFQEQVLQQMRNKLPPISPTYQRNLTNQNIHSFHQTGASSSRRLKNKGNKNNQIFQQFGRTPNSNVGTNNLSRKKTPLKIQMLKGKNKVKSFQQIMSSRQKKVTEVKSACKKQKIKVVKLIKNKVKEQQIKIKSPRLFEKGIKTLREQENHIAQQLVRTHRSPQAPRLKRMKQLKTSRPQKSLQMLSRTACSPRTKNKYRLQK